ncbi:hypothetical protein ACLQ3C_21325 [Gordonia sp. DT30]|uniref:hypothetical protein n=1 Tax=Gordonia sp. DT30 TaxID=3416546 RepID=UPI003CE7C903
MTVDNRPDNSGIGHHHARIRDICRAVAPVCGHRRRRYQTGIVGTEEMTLRPSEAHIDALRRQAESERRSMQMPTADTHADR